VESVDALSSDDLLVKLRAAFIMRPLARISILES
jgi:hypothetical protein